MADSNCITKTCNRCGALRPVTDFHAKRTARNVTCKFCVNANTRSRYTPALAGPSVEERFWGKVDKTATPDGCWLWTGSIKSNGYGKAYVGSKPGKVNRSIHEQAHRMAYKLTYGTLPEDRKTVICHTCDKPACCNPAHLFVATQKENLADMYGKGRRTHKRNERGVFIKEDHSPST